MNLLLGLGLLCAGDPAPPRHDVAFRLGSASALVRLDVRLEKGSLAERERALLAGWSPSADGSDPLDHLLPQGRLLQLRRQLAAPHADAVTAALFEALDANRDGKVDRSELLRAESVLLKTFDTDGDRCLTPLEIVPDLLNAEGALKERRDAGAEFGRGAEPKLTLPARVGHWSRTVLHTPDLTIDFLSLPPLGTDVPPLPKGLQRADAVPRTRFEGVAASFATLSVRPQRRGWFELLDANGDGQLSVRELRQAREHLPASQEAEAGFLTRPDPAAKVLSVTLAPGTGHRPPVRLVRVAAPLPAAPVWFSPADRNLDGDLDPTEFLGTADEFRQYDLDRDGLISAAEAGAVDARRGVTP